MIDKSKKATLIAKISLYSLAIIVFIVGLIVCPKTIINKDKFYNFSVSIAETNDENLILYEYKVYATEERMNKAFETDIPSYVSKFKERSEVLAVKIYGETKQITVNDDYILIVDPSAYELNIEYYIAQNLVFNGTGISCRSFILLAYDIFTKIDWLLMFIYVAIAFAVVCPCTIGLIRSSIFLANSKNGEINKNDNTII